MTAVGGVGGAGGTGGGREALRSAAGPAAPSLPKGTSSAVPTSPDHLTLAEQLLSAGQFDGALHLLDPFWHHATPEERNWYFRLWALVGQGRVLAALELCRLAAGQWPGSAAVAYLQAVLEQGAGHPAAAVEAARRAAANRPEAAAPEHLLAALLSGAAPREGEAAAPGAARDRSPDQAPPQPSQESWALPSPLAAATAGATLLFPPGSRRPLQAVWSGSAAARNEAGGRSSRRRRRRWRRLVALTLLLGVVVLVRDPLLVAALTALLAAWLTWRNGRPDG